MEWGPSLACMKVWSPGLSDWCTINRYRITQVYINLWRVECVQLQINCLWITFSLFDFESQFHSQTYSILHAVSWFMAMICLGIFMSYVILIFSNPLLLSLKGPRVSLLGLVLNLSVPACLYPTVGRYSTQMVSLTNAPIQENVWGDSPTHTHTQSRGTMRMVPLVYALRTWSSLNQWKPR